MSRNTPLYATSAQMVAHPPVARMLAQLDAAWADGSGDLRRRCAPPTFLSHFTGLDRAGLHWSHAVRQLNARFLAKGTIQRQLNETRVLEMCAGKIALDAAHAGLGLPDLARWCRTRFESEVNERNEQWARACASGSERFVPDPRTHPLAFADILLELIGVGGDAEQVEMYFHHPDKFVSDFEHGAGPVRPLTRVVARDMLRMDAGVARYNRQHGATVLDRLVDRGISTRPELLPQYLLMLGGASAVGHMQPAGLEIGDLLVKTALDVKFGRASRATKRALPPIQEDSPSSAVIDDSEDGVAADAASLAANSEARIAVTNMRLQRVLKPVLDALDVAGRKNPAAAFVLARQLVELIGLIRESPERALRAALLYEWTRQFALPAVTRAKVGAAFRVSTATIGRWAPDARSRLDEVGLLTATRRKKF